MAQDAKGKLTLEFLNTDNEKFTETPFYVDANLLQDNTVTADDLKSAIMTANSMVASLVSGTLTAQKLTYDVPLV